MDRWGAGGRGGDGFSNPPGAVGNGEAGGNGDAGGNGGAVGNGIDRLLLGGVADFYSLHAFGFYWYVFNIADAVIVAGVVGLLYDSLFRGHKKAGNPSRM